MNDAASTPYPPAHRRLRLGIVGGGLVSRWHHLGMRLSDRWQLLAGALSSDPERARERGREWHFDEERIYTDFSAMAAAEAARDDGIDAVVICTPNDSHRAIAEAFMHAGIDVICDKPICNTLEDADAMVKLQRDTGLVFAVTHPYAFHPMVRQAKAMIAAGAIGEPRQFMLEYAQDWALSDDGIGGDMLAWRRDPARTGRSSATADIGTHALQLLETVCGQRVARLRAEFHVCGRPMQLEDTSFLNLQLENGAPGALWLTQVAAGNHCGLRLRVYGERGGLAWDQEYPEHLYYSPLGEPTRTLVRGHGADIDPAVERMLTLPRGHPESLSDAWGNLYREIALAVAARRDGIELEAGMIDVPGVDDGAHGVRFSHAAADSNDAGGAWQTLD